MATVFAQPSDGTLHSLMMTPVMPPLEPLPLDDLYGSPPDEPHPLHTRTYRRRCTAALASLLAGWSDISNQQPQDETRCRYPSKLCTNTRVRKASGALHRYCAYHRDKANANQKRWVGRQRGEIASSSVSSPCSSTASSTLSSPVAASSPPTKLTWMSNVSEPCASAATLSDDEWDALLSLLDAPATPPESQGKATARGRRQRSALASGRQRKSPLG